MGFMWSFKGTEAAPLRAALLIFILSVLPGGIGWLRSARAEQAAAAFNPDQFSLCIAKLQVENAREKTVEQRTIELVHQTFLDRGFQIQDLPNMENYPEPARLLEIGKKQNCRYVLASRFTFTSKHVSKFFQGNTSKATVLAEGLIVDAVKEAVVFENSKQAKDEKMPGIFSMGSGSRSNRERAAAQKVIEDFYDPFLATIPRPIKSISGGTAAPAPADPVKWAQPRENVELSGRVTIEVTIEGDFTEATLLLDGEKLASFVKAPVTLLLDTGKYKSGDHTLAVMVTLKGGKLVSSNRAVKFVAATAPPP